MAATASDGLCSACCSSRSQVRDHDGKSCSLLSGMHSGMARLIPPPCTLRSVPSGVASTCGRQQLSSTAAATWTPALERSPCEPSTSGSRAHGAPLPGCHAPPAWHSSQAQQQWQPSPLPHALRGLAFSGGSSPRAYAAKASGGGKGAAAAAPAKGAGASSGLPEKLKHIKRRSQLRLFSCRNDRFRSAFEQVGSERGSSLLG